MSINITVALLKSKAFLDIDHDQLDAAIQVYIDMIINNTIDYLDDEDVTSVITIPSALQYPLCKQINKEIRRRADPGLKSIIFPDGSINKIDDDEWIPSVKRILDRHKKLSV